MEQEMIVIDLAVEMYRSGWELDEIADYLKVTTDDVINKLLKYKSACRGKKGALKDEFKTLVCDRINNSDDGDKLVASTLGMSCATVSRIKKEFGHLFLEAPMYIDIDWDKWDECPTCHSTNVNEVGTHDTVYKGYETDQKNSYCMDCCTEWLLLHGEVKKVNWEQF